MKPVKRRKYSSVQALSFGVLEFEEANTGDLYLVDVRKLMDSGRFEKVFKNEAEFLDVNLDTLCAPTWGNGWDICPDTIEAEALKKI